MLAAASIRPMATPLADRAVAAYVQSRLQRDYESEPRGYMASLARKVDMSTAHLANAKNKGSVGGDLAQKLAKVWGMSWDELRAAAGVATASERTLVPDEAYPNREVAIELVAAKVPPEVIRAVRLARNTGPDLTVAAWLARIRELQALGEGYGEPVTQDLVDAARPAKRAR